MMGPIVIHLVKRLFSFDREHGRTDCWLVLILSFINLPTFSLGLGFFLSWFKFIWCHCRHENNSFYSNRPKSKPQWIISVQIDSEGICFIYSISYILTHSLLYSIYGMTKSVIRTEENLEIVFIEIKSSFFFFYYRIPDQRREIKWAGEDAQKAVLGLVIKWNVFLPLNWIDGEESLMSGFSLSILWREFLFFFIITIIIIIDLVWYRES